jgi:hypothetical protein
MLEVIAPDSGKHTSVLFNDEPAEDSFPTAILMNDTVHFKKGQTVITKSYISPNSTIGNDSINPQEIGDQFYVIANCLVILRNVHSAGHFCHIPSIDHIEIYPVGNKPVIINKDESGRENPNGFDFVSNFLGNRFSSPSGKWGLITIEAEGILYGFLIVRSNGNVEEFALNHAALSGETYSAEFEGDDKLVWGFLEDQYNPVNLRVESNGKYKIVKKK